MKKLPHWVIPDVYPALYDTESATAIEMTAKLYAAISELIGDYNNWVDKVNNIISEFTNATKENYELFKLALRQEFQDFIDVVNLKMQSQDKEIADAIAYMKDNLRVSIRELIAGLRVSGELNQDILDCFADFEAQITALERMIDSITLAMTYDEETEALTMSAVLVEGSNDIIYTRSEERIDII